MKRMKIIMQDLIKRIEAADGPLREFDKDVAIGMGWTYTKPWSDGNIVPGWKKPNGDILLDLPYLTSSIDAAMTLVPDGWRVYHMADETSTKFQSSNGWIVCVDNNDCHGKVYKQIVVHGKTPALALCAAALRAVMAKNEG